MNLNLRQSTPVFRWLVIATLFAIGNYLKLVPDLRAQEKEQIPVEFEMKTVKGEFDVKIIPQESDDPKMGVMKLDKTYHGALNGTGKGRMLTGIGGVQGSAAYVAMERIEASLDGKKGSFIIHHQGVMNRGEQSLAISIVPDSGTEQLIGIAGRMKIDIRDGKHFYELEYEFKTDADESKAK